MNVDNLSQINKQFSKSKGFEDFVCTMFQTFGFEVEREVKLGRSFMDFVIYFCKNEVCNKYYCEIKYSHNVELSSKILDSALNTLLSYSNDNGNLLLITNSLCSSALREFATKKGIDIIDLSNLLYLLKDNNKLYSQFLSLLDFSVSDIIPTPPKLDINFNEDIFINFMRFGNEKNGKIKELKEWKNKFNNHKSNSKSFVEYENLCTSALKLLFSDSLSIWKKQQKSNNDLFRFDLICKTKADVKDDFFWTINNYFNTRYIVFEFKDYKKKISQSEIYTTEKYLYDKALRKVAIIISNYGEDKNAKIAIKGVIREQGKLIISLSNRDMITMLEKFYENYDAEPVLNYLSAKLDELLIELEK